MEPKQLRCRSCRALLGTEDAAGLSIRRSGMRAVVPRAPEALIVCHRCGSQTTFILRAGSADADTVGKK